MSEPECSKIIIRADGHVELPDRLLNHRQSLIQRIDLDARDAMCTYLAVAPYRIDVDLTQVYPQIREALGDPHFPSPAKPVETLTIQCTPEGTRLTVNGVELLIPYSRLQPVAPLPVALLPTPEILARLPPGERDFWGRLALAGQAVPAPCAQADSECRDKILDTLKPFKGQEITPELWAEVAERIKQTLTPAVQTYDESRITHGMTDAKEGEPCTNAKSQSEISDPDPKRSST